MSKTRKDREGNIRLRADGRWEVRVTIGIDYATGEERRISRYAKTQEEAIKLLHELSFIRDHTPNNFQSVTVSEWLPFCLETYMRPTLKQSTYLSYESYIRVHLNPALGNIQLKELTPRILQQYYNYKAETEKLSPKTIVNLNLFLHKALSFAVAEGYINSNPADGVNLPRGSKPQIVILTRDEQARLMQCSYQHRYGVFVRLVLFTGLRLGELLGLRWEDIDFRAGILHVRRTLNRLNKMKRPLQPGEPTTEIVIQTPKSQNSIRAIPLLPVVLQELQGWQYVQQKDAELAGDQYNASGYTLIEMFPDGCNYVVIAGTAGHMQTIYMDKAMDEILDPAKYVRLDYQNCDFSAETALTKAADMITAYGIKSAGGQIDCIIVQDGGMSTGVISALEAAGFKPGDVKFIAMGSNMVLYDAMVDGWLSACSTQDPVAEGKLAVETLYAVLQGTATPGWTKLPTPVAYPETKDNFSWFE